MRAVPDPRHALAAAVALVAACVVALGCGDADEPGAATEAQEPAPALEIERDDKTGAVEAVGTESPEDIEDYWTPERMKDAKPAGPIGVPVEVDRESHSAQDSGGSVGGGASGEPPGSAR